MKVQDLAKTLRKPVKEMMKFLNEMDIKVKSPSTRLDDSVVAQVKSVFKGESGSASSNDSENKEVEIKTIPFNHKTIVVSELAAMLSVKLSEIMMVTLKKGCLSI